MSLVIDATTPGGLPATGTSASFSHTCGTLIAGGLFLAVSARGVGATAPTNFSATYAGVAMTKVGEVSSSDLTVALFYLLKPASGANTVAIAWTTAAWGDSVARSYEGVHQGTPVLAGSYTTGTSALGTPTINVPSMAGDVVLDVMGCAAVASSTPTAGAGQTAILAGFEQNGGAYELNGASTEPGASGTVTMDWTAAGTQSVMAGMTIHAALRSTGVAISPTMMF